MPILILMIDLLTYITWDVEPVLFNLGSRGVRWYGLLFASGFFLAYLLIIKVFQREKVDEKWAEKLLMYFMAATIIGARLGHVLFYEWDYYQNHLSEIPQVWKGGLASHGATIGILIALYLYSKWVTHKPMLWILDRAGPSVAIVATFVRLGNLMNSEIVGKVANVPWAFIFPRVDLQPRHPVQLYEAFSYMLIFFVTAHLYWKTSYIKKPGFIFGTFLVMLFGARFFLEIFKKSQGGIETFLGNSLSTGQWLSIPLVIVGAYYMYRATQKKELA